MKKEKSEKPIGQSSSSNLGKRKDFEGPRARKYDRGGSLGWKQSRTIHHRTKSSYLIRICDICGKLNRDICYRVAGAYYNCGGIEHFS